jgi:excisionase family DNA binding protein
MNKLYTPVEVAHLFKTGVRTVRIWLRKGVLKGFKDKSFWLIRQEDIDEFIMRKNSLSDKVKLEAVIYNANKQPVGKVQFTQTAISILHNRKVPFVLNNAEITAACREIFLANAVMRSKPKIDDIANYCFSPRLAISLYDDYYLR